MEWISVEDRLPEHGRNYLVSVNGWVTYRGWYRHGYGWELIPGNIKTNKVTHWVPLPDPPE